MFLRTIPACALILAAFTPAAAFAQESTECPAALTVSPKWSAWQRPADPASSDAVEVGTAYLIPLLPMEEVPLQGFDGEELMSGQRAAAFSFSVEQAGQYEIAVDDPMWIDVVGASGVLESTTHGHGPDCSGIRKVVGFPLEAGTYRLELHSAQVSQSLVMVLGPVD